MLDIRLLLITACFAVLPSPGFAEDIFPKEIQPFLKKHCFRCHNAEDTRGELDLTRFKNDRDVIAKFRKWNHIIEFVRDGEMPPEEEPQPTLAERNSVLSAIESLLLTEAKKHAGDPGAVPPRRLSNTEYDASIRDLTGVDLHPTKNFPPDPAGGEGFDNTGEALAMSPSLVKKYLGAAQTVSEHLVLTTEGVRFAPFPVTSYAERKKFAEQAVLDFYAAHAVNIADYLEAAWRYRFRPASDRAHSPADFAEDNQLSPRYLTRVWEFLENRDLAKGPLSHVAKQWNALPAPSEDKGNRPAELRAFTEMVVNLREKLTTPRQQLIKSNAGNWPIGHLDFRAKVAAKRDTFDPSRFVTQAELVFERLPSSKKQRDDEPIVLTLRANTLSQHSKSGFIIVDRPIFSRSRNRPRSEKDEKKNQVITLRSILEKHAPDIARDLRFGQHPKGEMIDADSFVIQVPSTWSLTVPKEWLSTVEEKYLVCDVKLDRESSEFLVDVSASTTSSNKTSGTWLVQTGSETAKQLQSAATEFCATFPNRFFAVDDRRGLAAGFHLVEGFFRDDEPLVEKVLSDGQRKHLDRLWRELDFQTESAETLLRGFVWFERSERHVLQDERFDFLRAEDPLLVTDAMLDRFEKTYLEKMRVKLIEGTLKPQEPSKNYRVIHTFFEDIREGLKQHQVMLKQAEDRALNDLKIFAAKAYRHQLTDGEAKELKTLYTQLRKQGQTVEQASRGTIVAILMSPNFCYLHLESEDANPPLSPKTLPLSDRELASRLSYFLWSSLPDEELQFLVESRRLHRPDILTNETRRMLKDPRAEIFAREFFGQWLRYRDYLSKDPINASGFPGYTDELREAMFEEPTRLIADLIANDQPITQLLDSDRTFVNAPLAKHYGGEIQKQYNQQLAKTNQRNAPKYDVWLPVTGLRKEGRGGLFGMAVVLTKNSAGERTSPVKRGFWTVHHLLGQHFPPPPVDVPELPDNEKSAPKSIRELLKEHASNSRCAMCHTHFDGLGLALEGFDPIGRKRTRDLAGRPIDDNASLPNGSTAEGIHGLIEYVSQDRKQDFVKTFCRKFLGYALGRSVLLSDQPLLDRMQSALEQNDYRFSAAFEIVVTSPQFLNRRNPAAHSERSNN